ncbi:Winged helix-turn-helix dna-binding domain, partial [Globisporangium splendens]
MALRKMDISALMAHIPELLAPLSATSMSPSHAIKAAQISRSSTTRKRIRKPVVGPKKPRKTRVIHNFTYEQLAQYFHLSQREAGKRLGVSAITMKRNCKRRGIQWPFRANKIQASRKVRCDSDSVSEDEGDERRDHANTDAEATSEDDEATTRTNAAPTHPQPPVVMARSNLDTMSEAAMLFARLPYLCVDEGKVTRDE